MFGMVVRVPGGEVPASCCRSFVVLFALIAAKNLVRGHIGREWMAIRDMDVAAEVIGIRPVYAKLSAFAVSSFIVGIAGALWGVRAPRLVGAGLAFNLNRRSTCCS
jgi:ABC-type branched-subunit amino acid transport system permease subunit